MPRPKINDNYKLLEDGTFYGEIKGFSGVYANAETLEACRDLLQKVLEGWIILGLFIIANNGIS